MSDIVCFVSLPFNEGSWASKAWRKAHPEELAEGPEGHWERIPAMEERREQLHLDPDRDPTGAVCVRPSGMPPPHGVRLTSAGRGNLNPLKERTNQPA